jgi:hypothetical protein
MGFEILSYSWQVETLTLLLGGDDGALVVENLPAGGCALPDGCTASSSFALVQGVGEEVGGLGEAAALGVGELPVGVCCIYGWCAGESLEDKVAAVASSGGTDLPVVRGHHAGEVLGGGCEFGAVKDGFAGDEFGQDWVEGGLCFGKGLGRHSGIVEAFS